MKFILFYILILYIQTVKSVTIDLTECEQLNSKNQSNFYIPKKFLYEGEEGSDLYVSLNRSKSSTEWCKNGNVELYTLIFNIDAKSNIGQNESNNTNNTKSIYFLNTGMLRVHNNFYNPEEYCVVRYSVESLVLKLCAPDCTKPSTYPCIRKCCSVGTMLNIEEGKCTPPGGNKHWIPRIYKTPYSKNPLNPTVFHPHYIFSPVSCGIENTKNGSEPIQFQFFSKAIPEQVENKIAWKLGVDGKLWYNKANDGWLQVEGENYCVDGILNFGYGEEYRGLQDDEAIVACPSDIPTRKQTPVSILYVVLMYISSIFLFLTAIVYVSLWDLQNVHGWTILSQVISMLFMYLCLATAHLYGIQRTSDDSGGICIVLGVASHFFFLSTFCWLTVINVDLYWTFRSLNPSGSGRSKGLKKFLWYLVFALSVPSTVIIVGLTLQNIYGDDLETQVILPRYGVTQCYVDTNAVGVYIYSIVGTLISVNFILIIVTAVTIFQFKKGTKQATSNRSSPNQSFLLFLKLFIVMGVSWIFEVVSWIDLSTRKVKEVPWYWIFFDILNILQAIAIFVIFVCKRRILKQLKCKYPCLNSVLRNPAIRFWTFWSKDQSKSSDAEMDQTPGASTRVSKLSISDQSKTPTN